MIRCSEGGTLRRALYVKIESTTVATEGNTDNHKTFGIPVKRLPTVALHPIKRNEAHNPKTNIRMLMSVTGVTPFPRKYLAITGFNAHRTIRTVVIKNSSLAGFSISISVAPAV